MLEFIHKLHVVTNDTKGLEAGYRGSNEGIILIRSIEDNLVFKVELTKIGDTQSNDVTEEYDKLFDNIKSFDDIKSLTEKDKTVYKAIQKLCEVLDLLKDFETRYSMIIVEKLMLVHKEVIYKGTITVLGEGEIEEYRNQM